MLENTETAQYLRTLSDIYRQDGLASAVWHELKATTRSILWRAETAARIMDSVNNSSLTSLTDGHRAMTGAPRYDCGVNYLQAGLDRDVKSARDTRRQSIFRRD